ncbi:TPA: DUF550 domain-containing protein [Klebsiella pneumoniae subsp. pneumoniae]|nr:DUF550 domain-containing protein [Klebsiella pneumoniae subsp. pneumoniae]
MIENTEITAEKLEEIRQRYRPTEVPECHICGAEMTIQCMSASRITYGCAGAIYDETGCHYAEGRSLADDHYAESRITVVDVNDPDVLALVEALEKAQKSNEFLKGQLSELANFNPDWDKLEASYDSWREIAAELLVAKERIAELEDAEQKLCAVNVTLDARAQLAAMDSEPVTWINGCNKSVPTSLRYLAENPRPIGGESSFNTAHLYQLAREIELMAEAPLYRHAQPAPERDQVRREHAEWSQATFGNVGPIGPLKHLSKEALEAAAEPDDLSEWADMQFLLWDAQRGAGITDEQITKAMIEKLAVNKARVWPEPKDGEPRLHIKEQPSAVVLDEIECDICGHISTDPEGRHHCSEDNSND